VKNTIEAKIEQSIEESWASQQECLLHELNSITGRIEDILTLEEYRTSGHQTEKLEKSFGSLGSFAVNTKSLSAILKSSERSTAIDSDRLERINKLKTQLNNIKTNDVSASVLFHLEDNSSDILDQAEAHLNAQAEVFRAIRVARLEAKAKYKPTLHDEFFNQFNWSHLDDDELELCSPIVVILDIQKTFEQQFVALLPLLSSGLPIKMITIQNNLSARKLPDASRAAVSSSSINIQLLPVAMQKVFVFQSVLGSEHFNDALEKGLKSPRPGLFSVFDAHKDVADSAVSSRSFPYFVYDPASSSDFVTRLDVSGNPDLESLYAEKELNYKLTGDQNSSIQIEQTFADYLLLNPDYSDQFSTLDNEGTGLDHVVPLSKYLLLSPSERLGKIPVVYQVDADKKLNRLIPSRNVILQSAEKLDSWQALRELTGIDNPLMQKSQKIVEDKLIAEKEQALQTLRSELETKSKERENQVVATAMHNLSLKLFGMNNSETSANDLISPSNTVETAPAPTAAPAAAIEVVDVTEQAEEISEEVWIESNLCTTCDECTDLNKNIFVYDAQKLAIVKDPKGGPFKDIVKAAELCPAHIIHPGTPQNPDEKNLAKLIEMAEPYQ